MSDLSPFRIREPGVPVSSVPYTPAADTRGWLDHTGDWITNTDNVMTVLGGILAILVIANLVRRRKRNTDNTPDSTEDITPLDRAITRVTALVATAVVAQGMWVFFAEVIRIHWTFRVVLFSFIEMQIIAAFRRTRRYLYRHGNLGNGPWTVLGLAAATATLAAVHVQTLDERLLRLFAAAVAAHMLIEELREERDILRFRNPDRWPPLEKWTDKVRKVAVLLGLAEPASIAVTEVATQRRIDRLSRLLDQFHAVTADTNPGRMKRAYITYLGRRVTRRTQAACKYINLAEDPQVRAMLLRRLAVVRGIVSATKPDAVTGDAWAEVTHMPTGDADRRRHIIDVDVTSDTGATATRHPVTDTDAPKVTPLPAATPTRQPSPRPTVTIPVTPDSSAAVADTPTVTAPGTAVTRAVTVTNGKVQPLARHLIDAQVQTWTVEQIEEYAAERARTVAADTGNKTSGMREYFLTCLALGVEPKGSLMARVVGIRGEGLGRAKAKQWHGELALDDAEQILRDAHDRVTAELADGGDGRD
ncbi:hypothetical protein [Verrucosispora sp. NA02020]|uniref:hypothetical protein n=1 Tax=Verrucosispora sp. NA02020 TaxID=2742132 RepID=UPI001590CA32|nr:hypothetical protein [Verrucosispora sp. NA02020]QKW17386.1 hypothetical protein HUT12_23355 [Verrucosispora sp. NA02020]